MSQPPERDPAIEHEPHLRGGGFQADPSEPKAARNVAHDARQETPDDHVEHSVWDEPGLSSELSGPRPGHALTYAAWLQHRISQTSVPTTWAITAVVALAAGPWAVLTALLGSGQHTLFGVINATTIGPLMEEVGKVAIALWVVEKKPFLFSSRFQIACCAIAGGLVFAVIENFMYLQIAIPDAPVGLIRWRWSVCVALHVGCSFLSGLGLIHVWSRAMQARVKPHLPGAFPYLLTAVVIHGVYNASMVVLELSGGGFD